MELRQLAYLVAVAEEASFTAAAAREHVAQPGVSAQVRRLEAELGEALLERTPGGVHLTEAGAAVLPHARAALAAVGEVRAEIDQRRGLTRGSVAMGVFTAHDVTGLPDVLASFNERHPAIDITLEEATSDALLDDVLTGRLDLALAGTARPAPPGIETATLADEPLVAAVAPDHPLAAQQAVTLRALVAHPLVCLPRGTGGRTALDDACRATGLRPHVAYEAGHPRVLTQLAARGLGVGIVPAVGVSASSEPLEAVTITRPRMRSRIELAWRSSGATSAAAAALIAHVREQLPSMTV